MSKLHEELIKNILNKNKGVSDEKHQVSTDISFDDIDNFGDKDSMSEMFQGIRQYRKMLEQKITFINDTLTKVIPFTRENLYLICAYSGSGKSTLAANVSFPLWKEQKKTLIISNEESKQDILFRIACLELNYNFNEYKKGVMPIEHQKECIQLFPSMAEYVKVIDVTYKNGLTSRVEGVKKALQQVQESNYSCVLIDYFQEVKYSIDNPQRSTYDVLADLTTFLKMYIKQSNIPVVLFAQLHSLGKRKVPDLDGRIKHCPNIIEAASVAIEMIPNFENKTTDLIIHKDRFGLSGQKIVCGFEKGRYVDYTEEFKNKIKQYKINKLANNISLQKLPDVPNEENHD